MLLTILAAARFGSVPVVTVGTPRVWERAQRPGAARPFMMVESLETRSDRFAIEFAGTTMSGTAEFPMVAMLMSVPPDVDSPVPSAEGGAAAIASPPSVSVVLHVDGLLLPALQLLLEPLVLRIE
jgi:hypothetical protein